MKRTFALVLTLAMVLILAGCTTSNPSAAPRATTAPTGGAAARAADTWSPGSSWAYRYESPRGSGTFEWVVDREEILDGVRFYVVTAGPREIYFRKGDMALYMEKLNGNVEVKMNPPIRLSSGVSGDKWELRYVREAPQQQAQSVLRKCAATGPVKITVPAGTFDTMKTTCVDVQTGETVYEAWYAPSAKQLARERSRFSKGDGWRERELIGMRLYTDH
jgi:hypothetical protein